MDARALGGKVKPRKAQLARAGGAPPPIAIDGASFISFLCTVCGATSGHGACARARHGTRALWLALAAAGVRVRALRAPRPRSARTRRRRGAGAMC
jgi:hypothetical protein